MKICKRGSTSIPPSVKGLDGTRPLVNRFKRIFFKLLINWTLIRSILLHLPWIFLQNSLTLPKLHLATGLSERKRFWNSLSYWNRSAISSLNCHWQEHQSNSFLSASFDSLVWFPKLKGWKESKITSFRLCKEKMARKTLTKGRGWSIKRKKVIRKNII